MSGQKNSPTEGLAQWGSPESIALTSNEYNAGTVAQCAKEDKLKALRERIISVSSQWTELDQQRAAVEGKMDALAGQWSALLQEQLKLLGSDRLLELATQALLDIGPLALPKGGER